LKGYSSLSKKVVGMYVPRYFDGEQFTNMRIDGFNPRDLNVTEKAYLDEASLIVVPASNTQKKCNYVAYWQFARDFTPDYGKGNRTLYDVYYYYDLGYWYVSEIHDAFVKDCPYTFSSYSFQNSYYSSLVRGMCDNGADYLNIGTNAQKIGWLNYIFNASSYEESAMDLYYTTANANKTLNGKCYRTGRPFSSDDYYDCFSKEEYLDVMKIKDSWMMKVVNGNYIPQSSEYRIQGKTLDQYLFATDPRFKECISYFTTNQMGFIGLAVYEVNKVISKIPNSNQQQCDAYIQEKRASTIKLSGDWSREGVANMIWSHYKNDYNIPKGTNLYPFNIQYAGIRCKENDTWRTYQVNPLSPNAQSPYVECNYSSSDPQVVNVGFNFQVKINPAFAMVSGSDSILESYNADYLRTLFQTYTFLSGNTTPTINIKNYTDGATITAYFSVNRSKEDGCTYVFLTNQSATKITETLKDLTYEAQKNAENVPPEVPRQLEVQVRLLKAEESKTEFFYYVDVIAKLVFRAFILFYYVVSIILFLYVIKLIIILPSQMINVMRSLGTSKKHREHHSILSKS
jgi:hypothetical protein